MSPVAAFHRAPEPLADELDEVFREHSRLVYRTAFSVTASAQDAEDIVQTLFLQLLRRGFPPDFRKNPRGYLYRAAINRALNVVKSRRRRGDAVPGTRAAEKAAAQQGHTMKPHARKIEDILKDSLPSAPRGEMEPALDRVHARLQADRYVTPRESEAHIEAAPVPAWSRPAMRLAAAAIVIAAAVWAGASLRDQNVYAVLEAADGSLYRIAAQETIRSSGAAGAVLSLADGSHVEIRSQSELSWDHAPDGMTIRLDAGSIIVSARKPGRQLYVETKDMTVALAGVAQATKAKGTTFLVNSANDGSRVAVIEGEARVRERSVETTLHPGEEVSTSPTLSAQIGRAHV